MAVVKFGALVTEISGKLGGHVLQKCGQSYSMRTQLSQRFTISEAGLLTTAAMSELASLWASLSASQRQSFTDHAASYPTKDRYGNTLVLTGYQLFIYLNRTQQLIGPTRVSTCSAFYNIGSLFVSWGAYSVGGMTFPLTYTGTLSSSAGFLLYCTDVLPANSYINNPKTKYFTFINGADPSPVNVWNTFASFLNKAPAVGDVFYIEMYMHNYNAGISNYIGTFRIAAVA